MLWWLYSAPPHFARCACTLGPTRWTAVAQNAAGDPHAAHPTPRSRRQCHWAGGVAGAVCVEGGSAGLLRPFYSLFFASPRKKQTSGFLTWAIFQACAGNNGEDDDDNDTHTRTHTQTETRERAHMQDISVRDKETS